MGMIVWVITKKRRNVRKYVRYSCYIKKRDREDFEIRGMWVYDNEIESIAGDFENGDLVTVHDFDGYFLGIGFINMQSKITVRLLSRKRGR